MSLTAEQKALLRREGLAKATPDAIREHADLVSGPKAEALREAAFDLEQLDEPVSRDAKPVGRAPRTSATSPVKESTRRTRKPAKKAKRRGPIGRAARDATFGIPERAIGGSIRSVGDLFWTWIGLLVLVGLVSLILTSPGRAVALMDYLTSAFERFVDPWSADGTRVRTKTTTTTTNTTTTAPLARV